MGRTAEVRVPWGSLQVTVSEPIAETADGKGAGHDASFVGVQVSLDGPEDLLVADRLPDGALQDPTFTLVADEKEYVLDGLTGWVGDDEIAQVARRQYVAVKGEPTRVSLRVGYDGVDQVIDGLTGAVDRDAAEPLYSLGFAERRAAVRRPAVEPRAPPTSARTSPPAWSPHRPSGPTSPVSGWADGGQELDGRHRADRCADRVRGPGRHLRRGGVRRRRTSSTRRRRRRASP